MAENKQHTKRQHYVPRTYLKAWEAKVSKLADPTALFDGINVFDGSSENGDGRTRDSILWMPNLYTVNFEDVYFLYNSCPKIRNYFVESVWALMEENRVYAYLKPYVLIKKKDSVKKHLCSISDWEFHNNSDDSLASGRAFRNQVNRLKCYLLEDSFNNFFENDWEKTRDTFIKEVNNAALN